MQVYLLKVYVYRRLDRWHNWHTNYNSCRNVLWESRSILKKNTHRINEYQDSNDSTSTTPRNAGCTFRMWDHKSFVFKKIKWNPSLRRSTASSGKIIVSKFCFSFLETTFIHFERLLCPSLSRDTRPLDSCCISFKILFPYLAYILLDTSCIYFVYVAPRKIFSHPWWCRWAAKAWILFLF